MPQHLSSPGDNAATLKTAAAELAKASELVKQIKLSARSMKTKPRKKLLQKVRTYETDMRELQQLAGQSQDKLDRHALLGGQEESSDDLEGGGGGGGRGGRLDAQLASDERRLARSSATLKHSLSRVYESTETAAKTLEDLQVQRESLLASKEKGQSVIKTAARARRTIGDITRQQLINKIMVYVVIGLVLAVLGIMTYFVLFR